MAMLSFVSLWLILASLVSALNRSWPHDYPGKPSGDLSPEWQDYYFVKDSLPNVTFELGRSWAGNVPTRQNPSTNETLFFWAFEREQGSLTAKAGERSDKPWAICVYGNYAEMSAMRGFFYQNGPIAFDSHSYNPIPNNRSWSQLVDMVWLDHVAGLGFSTLYDNETTLDYGLKGVVSDFWRFIENFVKVFPSLAERPLYLIGTHSGGTLVTHYAKAYFGMKTPPAKLGKLVLIDTIFNQLGGLYDLPTLSIIETFPQLIGYDTAVYDYFKSQSQLCGYEVELTYPQSGPIPYVELIDNFGDGASSWDSWRVRRDAIGNIGGRDIAGAIHARYKELGYRSLSQKERSGVRWHWKRDLSGRANGTIDPWYQCYLQQELIDYAANFTFPWNAYGNFSNDLSIPLNLNTYDASTAIDGPYVLDKDSNFMDNAKTRAALHAPTSKNWKPFGPIFVGLFWGLAQQPVMFMNELAANASAHDVSFVFFHGNGQIDFPHRATEVVIQNTTFGGIQGFSRRPSTPWSFEAGSFGGIVHQERNWTYGIVHRGRAPGNTGYSFLRDFVFGNNQTGLVSGDNVIGGEDSRYAGDAIPAPDEIWLGTSGSITGTYTAPSATIAAWKTFIATAAAESTAGAGGSGGSSSSAKPTNGNSEGNAAVRINGRETIVVVVAALTSLATANIF